MARCFVSQPFDAGEFDKRYGQVYGPAIKAAGLEPYRVDREPKGIDKMNWAVGCSGCGR